MISAIGLGSQLDLTNVTSFAVNYGDNGSWSYSVNVRSNGLLNFANLGQLTGASQDDWLVFNLDSAGAIRWPKLGKVSGRTILNLGNPTTDFPALWSVSDSTFNLASNTVMRMPALLTLNSASVNFSPNSSVQAAGLVSASSLSLSMATNSSFIPRT